VIPPNLSKPASSGSSIAFSLSSVKPPTHLSLATSPLPSPLVGGLLSSIILELSTISELAEQETSGKSSTTEQCIPPPSLSLLLSRFTRILQICTDECGDDELHAPAT
ncbi:hypothetical protein ADUPG1_005552, partial [Aduncisulcus paluster]